MKFTEQELANCRQSNIVHELQRDVEDRHQEIIELRAQLATVTAERDAASASYAALLELNHQGDVQSDQYAEEADHLRRWLRWICHNMKWRTFMATRGCTAEQVAEMEGLLKGEE